MTARQILIAAQQLCARSRTNGHELATTTDGIRCRPLDDTAENWSPTGAVLFTDPWMSRDNPLIWADTTPDGEEALRLLDQAALRRGYANAVRCSIDGGAVEEQAMFRLAISLAPAGRRDRRVTR